MGFQKASVTIGESAMENKLLYHYTSLKSFCEIIRNRQFRLFDITKSNDPLEGIFLIDAIKEYV